MERLKRLAIICLYLPTLSAAEAGDTVHIQAPGVRLAFDSTVTIEGLSLEKLHAWVEILRKQPASKTDEFDIREPGVLANQFTMRTPNNRAGSLKLALENYHALAAGISQCESERQNDPSACTWQGQGGAAGMRYYTYLAPRWLLFGKQTQFTGSWFDRGYRGTKIDYLANMRQGLKHFNKVLRLHFPELGLLKVIGPDSVATLDKLQEAIAKNPGEDDILEQRTYLEPF